MSSAISIIENSIVEQVIRNNSCYTNKEQRSSKKITVGGVYGWILEAIRHSLGLTQANMAIYLGIKSKSNYYKIEKGLTEVEINQLYYFCSQVNLPIIEMIILHDKIIRYLDDLEVEVVKNSRITAIHTENLLSYSNYKMIENRETISNLELAISTLSDKYIKIR